MEFKMIQNDSNLHFLEKSRELTWINMICHRFLPSTSIYQIWPSTMVAYWSWPILAWDKPGKAVIQFSRHCLWRQPRSPVSWVSRGSPVGLPWVSCGILGLLRKGHLVVGHHTGVGSSIVAGQKRGEPPGAWHAWHAWWKSWFNGLKGKSSAETQVFICKPRGFLKIQMCHSILRHLA